MGKIADIAEAKLRQQVGIIDEQTREQQKIIESQAIATKRAQEGYTYNSDFSDFTVTYKVMSVEFSDGEHYYGN